MGTLTARPRALVTELLSTKAVFERDETRNRHDFENTPSVFQESFA
jgi:hypothetical protein